MPVWTLLCISALIPHLIPKWDQYLAQDCIQHWASTNKKDVSMWTQCWFQHLSNDSCVRTQHLTHTCSMSCVDWVSVTEKQLGVRMVPWPLSSLRSVDQTFLSWIALVAFKDVPSFGPYNIIKDCTFNVAFFCLPFSSKESSPVLDLPETGLTGRKHHTLRACACSSFFVCSVCFT